MEKVFFWSRPEWLKKAERKKLVQLLLLIGRLYVVELGG